ncbi:hypothetical protein R5W23_003082 [Gemmata sp. JC673]|uniref:SPOR domain-containing protein n=1 Tax=Gemmata algarum TaxID=2975278 RepID=A0ABU5ET77_9BACT|nr:hypothetical protein [Gemmata algarum]MDY3557817.1 hypothetical protein [Gemmata algarum]
MRKKALLGAGLALLTGGVVVGQQSGTSRPAPALPAGVTPVGSAQPTNPVAPAGGAYLPPTSGIQPASVTSAPVPLPTNIEIKTALGADHPWLLKPEHGAFFIMVKSYVRPAQGTPAAKEDPGPSARELAEALAHEIRDTYRVPAFLFEYISEERKAEMRQIAAARQKAQAYAAEVAKLRQRSQFQGTEFLEPDNKMHVMTHHHRDQIGVLVGGFKTEEVAKEALLKLKTWPTPKNEILVDKSAIVQTGANGKSEIVKAAINPYASAFVVPNPTVPRSAQPQQGFDPFIVKLNEGMPYNLLKAKKGWTLAVKSFVAPVEVTNKESTPSVMQKMGFSKGADALAAGAEQAEGLAKALRQMKGPNDQGLNLEAFVLHTRNASLVTVGQFDGPDDPSLLATKRLLAALQSKTRVTEDKTGLRPVANAPTLFDNIMPMPIPKAKG